LYRFAVLCTYQEANFAYERARGVGFSADKFLKNQINSNQIKWRKGICQTAAHHHHALSEVAFFNPFGGVPIPEKMGDPILRLNCMYTHP
jgi:hypothetical protein